VVVAAEGRPVVLAVAKYKIAEVASAARPTAARVSAAVFRVCPRSRIA
jgi:hypothetical protein